ncbi:type II toxin-antitoxin system VapC family toxin [Sandarakinorhabdus sp.]|jgi:toxin FitB|uniref:type II toxin-antitoxin system VapC family toxin n=1 Tax=Sandarakinorhabdus sp. TaxID=1916663 RepID=UPI00333E24B7
MTPYLFDTMVASVGFNPRRHPGVAAWLASGDVIGWFSTITLGEIRRGIVLSERRQPALAGRLEAWFDALLAEQAEQFLPVTTEVAEQWGRLSVQLGRKDADLLIAATAQVHGLVVATRNIEHFAPTGVALFNPWDD